MTIFFLHLLAHAMFGPLPWGLSSRTGAIVAMCIFFGSAVPSAVLAFVPRCDSCGKRFFVEGFREKHPTFTYRTGLNAWATTVINVLRRKAFQCMYLRNKFPPRMNMQLNRASEGAGKREIP